MRILFKKFTLLIILGIFIAPGFLNVHAQTTAELEQQIEDREEERQELEREAERIRQELTEVGAEKGVLTAELNRINADRRSLESSIKKTENKIDSLSSKIFLSEKDISQYNSDIKTHSGTVAALLRGVEQRTNMSFFEVLASAQDFSDFFRIRDAYTQIQTPLIKTTQLLEEKKIDLRKQNMVLAEEQDDLESERFVLDDQRSIVQIKEDEKANILNITRKKESSVQNNLNTTLATIQALNAEIRNFESKLEFALNPNSIPQKGSAVFGWPLSSVLITQRFGKTVSSERLYVSGSHSGMDFRAAVGTPVYAVADGVVKGIGNTDAQCYRASFGKWVFIDHDNGLSTTSAHLSTHKVKEGDQVKKGDLIAYSGNSGRSTAPHLHLTVYATKGVNGEQGARVTERPSSACPGTDYRMPLAPTSAYLDPLAYLPKTDASFFKHN
ncbi:MAG: murein DD-endopeptidase MepM/ murein hydrolase activator NlpD [Candidatus Paceibacteria bacterium]|jgi:murein DD-endopeptidase MepM/ murein hydrolase activator NlpD